MSVASELLTRSNFVLRSVEKDLKGHLLKYLFSACLSRNPHLFNKKSKPEVPVTSSQAAKVPRACNLHRAAERIEVEAVGRTGRPAASR